MIFLVESWKKHAAQQIALSLASLFNKSLYSAVVPDEWKLANVAPVFKRGIKEHVQNYRPIFLLCIVLKVLERCVLNHIWEHLYKKSSMIITTVSCQAGIALHNLWVFWTRLEKSLTEESKLTSYTWTWPKHLTKSITNLWSTDFVASDSKQTYSTGFNFTSTIAVSRLQSLIQHLSLYSGVPQGSILGPILFLLYVNDLPDAISSSIIVTFVDDTKLFKRIASNTDSNQLQEDLNTLEQWSTSSNLAFNPTKSKVETISRKRSKVIKTCYTMGDLQLKHCSHERDLGVWISTDLTWKKQVESRSGKANKILGYVKRTSNSIKSIDKKRTIYLTIVRAHLAYSSPVWTPQTVDNINNIERIQRRATKCILGLNL